MDVREFFDLIKIIGLSPWLVWTDIPFQKKVKFSQRYVDSYEQRDGKITFHEVFVFVDKNETTYTISIDEDGMLWSFNSLLEKPYMGSGGIGLFFFSIPMLPLWAPFVFPTEFYYLMKEQIFKKSRRAIKLLRRVKKTMPKKDYEDLKAALELHWALQTGRK